MNIFYLDRKSLRFNHISTNISRMVTSMLVTDTILDIKCVGDKFEMLVADLIH